MPKGVREREQAWFSRESCLSDCGPYVNITKFDCCTKVIMSGVNGNVIMSGCRDDNPDDERREAARDNTKSVSRGADSSGGRDGDRSQRATVLPDQSWGNQARGEGSGAWESGSSV